MLRNWTSNQVRHRQINRKLPNRRTNKMEKKSPQGEGRKRKKNYVTKGDFWAQYLPCQRGCPCGLMLFVLCGSLLDDRLSWANINFR